MLTCIPAMHRRWRSSVNRVNTEKDKKRVYPPITYTYSKCVRTGSLHTILLGVDEKKSHTNNRC